MGFLVHVNDKFSVTVFIQDENLLNNIFMIQSLIY